ncbi:MAG: hypothetical protein ACOVR6_00465 [Fimbriimonas sp.]
MSDFTVAVYGVGVPAVGVVDGVRGSKTRFHHRRPLPSVVVRVALGALGSHKLGDLASRVESPGGRSRAVEHRRSSPCVVVAQNGVGSGRVIDGGLLSSIVVDVVNDVVQRRGVGGGLPGSAKAPLLDGSARAS